VARPWTPHAFDYDLSGPGGPLRTFTPAPCPARVTAA
jgi:hypothetical protein